MRMFEKMSARLTLSLKYRRTQTENSIKRLVFMYHEAMSIFLGCKNVLCSVYLRAEYIFGL